jgi:Glycosyltransferase sugar-binding region containing DXD motif
LPQETWLRALANVEDLSMRNNPVDQIHQILINDTFHLPAELPAVVQQNAESFRTLYPNAQYRLWGGAELRDMIAENFKPSVVDAFDLLKPFAYKCDLARLCLLYQYGGLYSDLAMRAVSPIVPPERIEFVAFKALRFLSPRWTAMSNGLIWAKPHRPEIGLAIDYILENCQLHYYGTNPLYPTGPVLFGHAVAAASARMSMSAVVDDQWIGELRRIVPESDTGSVCYVAPDNSLVAISAKTGGGELSVLGVTGTNNYSRLWHSRKIYGERETTWEFDNPAICRQVEPTATGLAIPRGFHGCAVYGPYIDLDPANYRLTVAFSAESARAVVLIRVTAHVGREIIHEHEQRLREGDESLQAVLEFKTNHRLSQVEFTLHFTGDFVGEFRRFTLERIDPA